MHWRVTHRDLRWPERPLPHPLRPQAERVPVSGARVHNRREAEEEEDPVIVWAQQHLALAAFWFLNSEWVDGLEGEMYVCMYSIRWCLLLVKIICPELSACWGGAAMSTLSFLFISCMYKRIMVLPCRGVGFVNKLLSVVCFNSPSAFHLVCPFFRTSERERKGELNKRIPTSRGSRNYRRNSIKWDTEQEWTVFGLGGYSFVMEREKEKRCRSEMVRISEEELFEGNNQVCDGCGRHS